MCIYPPYDYPSTYIHTYPQALAQGPEEGEGLEAHHFGRLVAAQRLFGLFFARVSMGVRGDRKINNHGSWFTVCIYNV